MPPAPNIRCPRCGYELLGVVASWSDRCPIDGTCTECGLRFEWAELISPTRRLPRWCVEYALRRWNVPGRSFQTLMMMLRPWRFWSELKMTHWPRWDRVLAMFAIVVVVLYAGFALTVGALVLDDARRTPARAAEVAYSVAYAILLPCSSRPAGPYIAGLEPPIGFAARFDPRVEGLDEVRFFVLTGSVRGSWRWRTNFAVFWVVAAVAASTVLTAPLGLMAVPISRRRARVMWWHVHRIMLYSLVVVAVALAAAFVRYAIATHQRPIGRTALSEVWFGTLFGVPVLLVAWWHFAIQRYLRMPHAFGIALALVAIGMLLGPALLVLIIGVVAAD